MNKTRSFTLISGIVNGEFLWSIETQICQNGSFHAKGFMKLRGNYAKMMAFKRSLGFHKISFWHEGCVWHHVNKNDVVATPEYIHTISSGWVGSKKITSIQHKQLEGVLG